MDEILHLLLVDDDAVDRMAIQRSLQRATFQSDATDCETCAAAIELLQQQPFDCVLLDYHLPDGDGLALVRQIREAGIQVPLIVLTGQGDEELAVELMKAGAADYFSKTRLSPEALSRGVLNAVRVHRAELQAAAATQLLRESEERYRLVLEGSNDGVWDWYICQNEVFCNDRLFEIIGLSREELGSAHHAFYQLIHPDDRTHVLTAMTAHLERGENFDVEFRLRHSSGGYRYCTARGKAQRDSNDQLFRMSGVVSDITDRKQAESAVAQLNCALERRVTELQTLLDVIPIGIAIATDPNCTDIRINPTYAKMLAVESDRIQQAGQPEQISFCEINSDSEPSNSEPSNSESIQPAPIPPPPFTFYRNGHPLRLEELPMQLAATQGRSVLDAEVEVVRRDGSRIDVLSYTAPLFDEYGHPRGCIGAFLDITDRKRIESTQQFLAEASALLSSSLDADAILKDLAGLVVPVLADFCFFDLTNSQMRLRRVVWRHVDACQQLRLSSLSHFIPAPGSNHPLIQCLSSQEPLFAPEVTDEWLADVATSADHEQFLRELDLYSWITVPLVAHDQSLGALTLCRTRDSQRHYVPADLELAQELARRTALAIDNAQLYRITQEAEQNLRQALIILGQHQQQLRTLQRLTDLLNQRLTNLPELMQVMVGAMCSAIPGAEFGLIVLQNPYTGLLELITATGIEAHQLQIDEPFAPGEGLLGEIFQSGTPQLVRLPTPDHPEANSELPLVLCAVPIASAQAGKLGVLAVGNWHYATAFGDEEKQLLVAFGEQAAIALTNAQLINALEEREERLGVQNRILGQQNRELERQRHHIQLQNLKLREAAQLKSQFIATMSHELRTPMTAVIGFSQLLLRQDNLTSRQRDMVERILNNGRNLLALINDILDLSKIEAGRLELRLEEINLAQLVAASTEELRSLADQKNLPIHLQISLGHPYVVNDITRLRQVLVNLLSNAIKFTEAGSVTVSVQEVDGDRVALQVQDTGIGIAEADLPHIFEEFRQVDQGLSKRFQGTGLGLAITDLLVRMMGGTISVQSQVGQGSTFRVEIPRCVCE